MKKRLRALFVLIAAGALATGGAALAQARGHHGHGHGHKAGHARTLRAHRSLAPTPTTDGDNVQQGDQNAPDNGAGNSESSSESGAGSEVSNNDGPNGHADENTPAGANADNQQQGEN